MQFNDTTASVGLQSSLNTPEVDELLIRISCREPDWQLSSIEQVCNTSLHPPSTVEDLYIEHQYSQLVWKDDAIENTLWLELLLPFTTVINLYISKEFTSGIAAALQELVAGRITEVLPSLQHIFVEEPRLPGPFQETLPSQEALEKFVAARQVSGHSIAISDWDRYPNTW